MDQAISPAAPCVDTVHVSTIHTYCKTMTERASTPSGEGFETRRDLFAVTEEVHGRAWIWTKIQLASEPKPWSPACTVVGSPASAVDTGSIPCPGESHMPPGSTGPHATTTEPASPRTHAPQQKKPRQ